MRCINKVGKCAGLLLLCMSLTGCGSTAYSFTYDPYYPVSSYRIINQENKDTAEPFAADICIVSGDLADSENVDMSEASSAALFDVNHAHTLYAKNVYEKLEPASLTKILTALVALKHGSKDDMLTASANVLIQESGAQLCGLKEGDTMTLDQALHILLINSANDVAVLIAENIAGSIEEFAKMMNEEAKSLGATGSNFVNPHGLSDDNHYTTAYDLYLIFNEAINCDPLFTEIIHMSTYSTVYNDADGNPKECSVSTTNRYLKGTYTAPEKVTVIGGKTGTTNAAGHCLILLTKDSAGNPFISVILRSKSTDVLYAQMSDLLSEIDK